MIVQIEDEWLTKLSDWAKNEPCILKAWVFGPRAKGLATFESDLDIAVELVPDEGEATVEWIKSARKWRKAAQLVVGCYPTIDLEPVMKSDDDIVWPAVTAHGILFYEKTN